MHDEHRNKIASIEKSIKEIDLYNFLFPRLVQAFMLGADYVGGTQHEDTVITTLQQLKAELVNEIKDKFDARPESEEIDLDKIPF